jgi:hypothetical protein
MMASMSSDALYAQTQESLRRSGEVVLVPSDRSAMLPTGGVFSPLRREPGRIDLGPPLVQRLADREPEPVVALALAERVLQDVELLHRLGGAHGAIDLDGWGFDDAGYFRVRPVFRADQELSQEADIRAVASAISALVTPEALEFAGFTQAKVWFQSLGSARLGDARSVRQGLVALIGRRPVQQPLQDFLSRVGGQLPPLARSFDVVPLVAPRPDVRLNQRDRAHTDARLWVEAERQRIAAEREQRRAALLARPDLQSWYEEEQKKAEQARFVREHAVAEAEAERRRLLERRREEERQRREATPVEAVEDEDSPVPFRTVQSPIVIQLEEPGALPPLGPSIEPAPITEEDSSGPVRVQVDLREEERHRLRGAVAVKPPEAAPLFAAAPVPSGRTPTALTSLFEVDSRDLPQPSPTRPSPEPAAAARSLEDEEPRDGSDDSGGVVVEGLPSGFEDDAADGMTVRTEFRAVEEEAGDVAAVRVAAGRSVPVAEEEAEAAPAGPQARPVAVAPPVMPVWTNLPLDIGDLPVEKGAPASTPSPVTPEAVAAQHDDEATDPGLKRLTPENIAAIEAEAAAGRAEEDRRQAKAKAESEERRQAKAKAEEEERRQAKARAEEEERRQAKARAEEEERRQAKAKAEAEAKKKEEENRQAAATEAQRRSEEAALRREAEERRRSEELNTQKRLEEGRTRVAEELARREAAGKGSAGDARSRLMQDPVRALNKSAAAEDAESLRASREPPAGGGKWSEGRASANPIVLPPPMKLDIEDLDDEAVLSDGRSVAEAGTWEGAPGISGSHDRDGEKGPGKWTASGRSVEELQAALPAGESRPLKMEQKGGGSWWMVVGVILLGGALCLVGWLFFGS